MLTDTRLRHLKPKEKLYKVNDRDGLYVAVTPAGTISFRYNYSINGRQETVTFGRYGMGGIMLAEARERLNKAKKMVAGGRRLRGKKPGIKRVSKRRRFLVRGLRRGCVAIKCELVRPQPLHVSLGSFGGARQVIGVHRHRVPRQRSGTVWP